MPILFGLTLIILVFMYFSKSRQKNAKQKSEEFWRKERAAQIVPAKDLSSLDYLNIAYGTLPFRYWGPGNPEPVKRASYAPPAALLNSNPEQLAKEVVESSYTLSSAEHIAPMAQELAEAEYEVCALSNKRILNLTGVTNTELRLTYGTMNLDPLTSYDQNYTSLIRSLQKWGALLVTAGHKEDAITVLSYAVEIGSDIAGTFSLLARLYKNNSETAKIVALQEVAENLTTLMKPSILRDLDKILNGDHEEDSQDTAL